MKVKNSQIIEAYQLIKGNSKEKLPESMPFKLSLALATYIEKAEVIRKVVDDKVKELRTEHKIEEKEGKVVGNIEAFNKAYSELLETETEIDIKRNRS